MRSWDQMELVNPRLQVPSWENPKYDVTQGDISLDGKDVLEMEVDERARAGLFLAMQYPAEVPGVTNSDFMRQAMRATSGKDVNLIDFALSYEGAIKELQNA